MIMVGFTIQEGLKLLFHDNRVPFGFEAKGLFPYKLINNSVRFYQKINKCGPTPTRVFSSGDKKFSTVVIKEHDIVYYEYGKYERDEWDCFRGLVLDTSYRPINVVCWRRAICLEFMEKADVLEYYGQTVNSPSGSFYIPAVLRVPHFLQVVKRRRIKQNLNRKMIFDRDMFTCQYCSSKQSLTIDHVLPISRGGEWKWENLVTACAKCNSRKGQKTLEEANMKLNMVPKAPKEYDMLAIPLTTAAMKTLRMLDQTPDEWRQYLAKPPSSGP